MRKHQRPRKTAPKQKRVRHSTKRAPAKPLSPPDYSGYDAYSRMYGYEVRDDFVDGGLTVPVDADVGGDPYIS